MLLELYRLVDGYNNDVLCSDVTLTRASEVAKEYDVECEGDWMPLLYAREENGRYVQVDSAKLKF